MLLPIPFCAAAFPPPAEYADLSAADSPETPVEVTDDPFGVVVPNCGFVGAGFVGGFAGEEVKVSCPLVGFLSVLNEFTAAFANLLD